MAAARAIRDQSYIKYRNIQTVLTLLAENQPISRTAIAHLTEMSPTSITRIVGALIALGLVDETHSDAGCGRGRRAINLTTRQRGICTIGVLLEPHRIRLGFVDFSNQMHHAHEIPVEEAVYCSPQAMAAVTKGASEHLRRRLRADGYNIRAVGVCVAGPVDCYTGIVARSDQMRWKDAPVGDAFTEAFGLPAYVENDAKACLIGEKATRGIAEHEDTAYLLLGTGVGLAVTANGKLLRGRRHEAGEIDGIPAGEGATIQDHLVESALVRRARKTEPAVSSVEDIIAAYKQDSPWAKMLVGDFRRAFHMAIQIIDGVCNPEHIILGGAIVQKLCELCGEDLGDSHIRIGGNYGDACVLGAAIIAQRQAVQTLITKELGS